ncbi:MAG TPA: hypothetical protein VIG30_11760 [Ktedonobacterales bacterium]
MRRPQPPSTNQWEYECYRAAAERLRQMMLPHERDLWHATQQHPADQSRIDAIRSHLAHLYSLFQDIQDQITAYEAKQPRSA